MARTSHRKLEDDFLNNVRYGGIAHIFAVSGLHIGVLFGGLVALFQKFGRKKVPKIVKFVCVVAVLVFYCGICGFTASSKRALICCSVGYFFTLTGMKPDFLETVGCSGIVILVLSPVELFSVGFALSFSASLGIAFLGSTVFNVLDDGFFSNEKPFRGNPKFKTYLTVERKRKKDNVLNFIAICISAQVFTIPVQLYFFGYVSGVGLLLNFIFVPIISACFSGVVVTTVASCILPFVAKYILFIPNALTEGVCLFFHVVDLSAFQIRVSMPTWCIFLWYFIAILLSNKINKQIWQKERV